MYLLYSSLKSKQINMNYVLLIINIKVLLLI